jgi:septum formation protein
LELLKRLIPEFIIACAELDEEALTVEDPQKTAEDLALAKALAVARQFPGQLVIGGDTVVELNGKQFAKPTSTEDAVAMLLALSGQEHRVISAVALIWPTGQEVFSETARVRFRTLSEAEARAYVATGEPMDKAGSYAIQGDAAAFVAELDGHIETVVGMPIQQLAERLGKISEPKLE